MSNPITPIQIAPSAVTAISPTALPNGSGTGDFQSIFQNAVSSVEASSSQADQAVASYLSGGTQELHSTILATQNADLNFEMFMQVRNKVVSAYEELMRLQV